MERAAMGCLRPEGLAAGLPPNTTVSFRESTRYYGNVSSKIRTIETFQKTLSSTVRGCSPETLSIVTHKAKDTVSSTL